jgi:predicted HicB family RNase H-like nuclease
VPETVVHFQIRMPPDLHERLASRAKDEKASLNALVVGILEQAVERHSPKTVTANGPADHHR